MPIPLLVLLALGFYALYHYFGGPRLPPTGLI